MTNERTALNTNQHHDEGLAHPAASSISPTSVVDFCDDDKTGSNGSGVGDGQLISKQQKHKQRRSSQSYRNHITEHVPFYLLYFFLVYLFLFIIQIGMLVVTVDTKWFRHEDEPTWIFPLDVMVVSMLTIEVSAHFIVSTKFHPNRGCIMQSIRPQLLVDFAIALLSIQMIILDVITMQNQEEGTKDDTNNDNNRSHAFIGLLRDALRIVRISEFVYILKRVLGDPDWHTNDSLSMNDVL